MILPAMGREEPNIRFLSRFLDFCGAGWLGQRKRYLGRDYPRKMGTFNTRGQ